MKLDGTQVLLTGASGGIGSALAHALAAKGARLILVSREPARLTALAAALRSRGAAVSVVHGDLSSAAGVEQLALAATRIAVPELLIHCAGQMAFGALHSTPPEVISRLWQTNVIAPSLLTRALLPAMQRRGSGRLVFVGSMFGSLAFPLYSSYSASKFALRGLAEALRRELADAGIGVTYVAPRYTRTAFNEGAPARLAAALRLNQDSPEQVAAAIVRAIESDRRELLFGRAERFFAWLNQRFPRLVDRALRSQARRMRELEPAASLGLKPAALGDGPQSRPIP